MLERIAVVARAQGERSSVELRLGSDLYLRVSGGAGGIDLVLDVNGSLAGWAESELPRLVSALRERGVTVTGALVRRARQAGRLALTSPQGSATRAASSPAHGTVAKW